MLENEVYIWLHRMLETEGSLSTTAIDEEFETAPDERKFANEYLDRLTREGVLREEDGVYSVADAQAQRAEYRRIMGESQPDSISESTSPHVAVLNVPTALQSEWEDYTQDAGIDQGSSLTAALKHVFDDADESLRLCTPYFDIGGLNILSDEFTELARRGTDVRILVRNVLGDDQDYWANRRRKGLLEALERYRAGAPEFGSIEIRDYYHAIGEEHSRVDRSIHAKLAISDSSAYVGSGEIRDSSMTINGEAGYLTDNSADITQYRTFFDFFWERAETVSDDQLSE